MKTECSIVRDLIPLYLEDMLSIETARFVKEHLNNCQECRRELEAANDVTVTSGINHTSDRTAGDNGAFKKIMKRLNRQFNSLAYSLIIFFIFLGFGWTGGENLMYNSIIMPIVGVFGYYVFRRKAIYKVPVLLLLIDLAVYLFQLVEIGFVDTLLWTLIYCIFVVVGIAIAGLLHFAFRREEKK